MFVIDVALAAGGGCGCPEASIVVLWVALRPTRDPCQRVAARPLRGVGAYHWKAVRAAAGWDKSLYLATRHFAGWYMVNVLELPCEDVAIVLGHQDGGNLVRRLYGHCDRNLALDRVTAAYGRAARAGASTPSARASHEIVR